MKIPNLKKMVAEGKVYSIVVAPYPAPRTMSVYWVVLVNGDALRTVRHNALRYFRDVERARRVLAKAGVKQFVVRMYLAELAEEVTISGR